MMAVGCQQNCSVPIVYVCTQGIQMQEYPSVCGPSSTDGTY
jgi:hypothetical protein